MSMTEISENIWLLKPKSVNQLGTVHYELTEDVASNPVGLVITTPHSALQSLASQSQAHPRGSWSRAQPQGPQPLQSQGTQSADSQLPGSESPLHGGEEVPQQPAVQVEGAAGGHHPDDLADAPSLFSG